VVQAEAHVGGASNAYRGLVGRAEGRIPLGRPRYEWNYSADDKQWD
jgi:hypothetical protein